MKKLAIILIILIAIPAIIAGVLYAKKEAIVADKLEEYLEGMTGSDVIIDGLLIEDNGNKIYINTLQIANPTGYGLSGIMAKVSEVRLEWNFKDYWDNKRAHFSKIHANLDEVNVYINEKGGVNLREMRSVSDDVLSTKMSSREKANPPFFADRIEIHYGKMFLHDANKKADAKTHIKFTERKDILGHVNNFHALIQLPTVKIISAMNRGSMGIPRTMVQRYVAESIGKPLAGRAR